MSAQAAAPGVAGDPRRVEATRMFREAAEAADCVRTQIEGNAALQARLGARLRGLRPRALVTCARGSSDHAATFARYLAETRLGLLSSSISPSVSSVYGVRQDLGGCLFLAFSQSGRSPDLIAAAESAARAGAVVVALVNDPDSPLARAASEVLPLHAFPETGVAATKSYIAMLAASLQLIAAWSGDAALGASIHAAPALLERAWALDWSAGLEPLAGAEHLLVVGRGLGLSIAQEAALKLKETCGLHAEAFSGAELRHGPMALVGPTVPVFAFLQDDATRAGLERLARDLLATGVPLILAGGALDGALNLPSLVCEPQLAPMLQALSFYRLANALAAARGLDPDAPPGLAKVTETR
ncbi:MAG TPA: SIS domain-containing protein [Steroidobacteraceae bacterium]|nr:SIS domain-containing protein [Steroidobacteraceae bacterium]